MSKIAFIFPGQGSQYVGMGKDLFEKSEEARSFFQNADLVLKSDLSKICFEGPEETLRQTMNTQPAIFIHSMALLRLIGPREVSMVAGHSLGEYSALVAAGSIDFEDGLRLVRLRGELMQKAGVENKGTMAAILGLEPSAVEEICSAASLEGIVQCANFNSPGQIVISGAVEGVRRAVGLSKERGAKMAKELVVSGAFHSPLMSSARDGLMNALQKIVIRDARIPVYSNVTAAPVTKAEEIRWMLGEQLTSPVRWEESVKNIVRDGGNKFVEIGPGKILQGLVKRICPEAGLSGIDKFEDIQKP